MSDDTKHEGDECRERDELNAAHEARCWRIGDSVTLENGVCPECGWSYERQQARKVEIRSDELEALRRDAATERRRRIDIMKRATANAPDVPPAPKTVDDAPACPPDCDKVHTPAEILAAWQRGEAWATESTVAEALERSQGREGRGLAK